MPRKIRFTVSGHGDGTDAPPVEDMLDQIRDMFEILRGVEEAVSGTNASAMVWRVVDANKNSPLAIELEPFAKVFATNIDQRVDIVVTQAALGLSALQNKAERPRFFTDAVMKRAHRSFVRVTNGLAQFGADFGPDLPKMELTPSVARAAARNVELALERPHSPYRELGSIEGHLQRVERDGFGRRVAYVRERITGEDVKCLVEGQAAETLEEMEVRDVWKSKRVMISGIIHRHGNHSVEQVFADSLRVLRTRTELPQFDDIVDQDFTGKLTAVDYLERLNDGTLT